ncbi:MAG: helix-turn-helix transcriptional regulator [Bacteroidota bacterium]
MNGNVLYDGQYLGETLQAFRTDMLLVKSTLHERSESRFHCHTNAYLSILLSGLYDEMTKDTCDKICPSYVIFRPSHYHHKNRFITPKTKCLNIEFSTEWFDTKDVGYQRTNLQIKHVEDHPLLLRLLIDFLKYDKVDFFEDLLLDLITGEENTDTVLRQPWLSKLVHILDNEIEVVHSLKSLSERVFVHPNYMSRVFKQHMGVTIGKYQIERKLQHATKKLFIKKDSIAAIALASGFFDEPHFIRTFKTFNGITPHHFRMLLNS